MSIMKNGAIMLGEIHSQRIVKAPILFFNSSSSKKVDEFCQIASSEYGKKVIITKVDFPEIQASPEEVMAHKTSCVAPFTIVEDTSLEVEGAQVGINIRWMIEKLPCYIGRTAVWRVLLGYRDEQGMVYLFQGEVKGKLISPRGGNNYGFDPYFLPEGSSKTLAEGKGKKNSARAIAIHNLMKNNSSYCTVPLITEWKGLWQLPFKILDQFFQGPGEKFPQEIQEKEICKIGLGTLDDKRNDIFSRLNQKSID